MNKLIFLSTWVAKLCLLYLLEMTQAYAQTTEVFRQDFGEGTTAVDVSAFSGLEAFIVQFTAVPSFVTTGYAIRDELNFSGGAMANEDFTPGDTNGRMLFVNPDTGATVNQVIFALALDNLCANTTFTLSYQIVSLFNGTNPNILGNIRLLNPGAALNSTTGNLIATVGGVNIPYTANNNGGNVIDPDEYITQAVTFTTPSLGGPTLSAVLQLVQNQALVALGNDSGIDHFIMTANQADICLAATNTVSVESSPAVANNADTVPITAAVTGLANSAGNGVTVTFDFEPATSSAGSSASCVTDSSGMCSVNVTSSVAGTFSVTASFESTVLDTGTFTFENTIDFTLAQTTVNLTEDEDAIDRFTIDITNVSSVSGGVGTFSVAIASGSIFATTNTEPEVSFDNVEVITSSNLSTAQTATLYFTVKPDTFGTGVLRVTLTQGAEQIQQDVTVNVTQAGNAPVIVASFPFAGVVTNPRVFGGNIYGLNTTAQGWFTHRNQVTAIAGANGDMLTIYSDEENGFIANNYASGLFIGITEGVNGASRNGANAEWYWLAEGTELFARGDNIRNSSDVAPGFYFPGGLINDFDSNASGTDGSNGPFAVIYSNANNWGDIFEGNNRSAVYEFQGAGTALSSIVASSSVNEDSGQITVITLSGADLDGDSLSWSASSDSGSVSLGTPTLSVAGLSGDIPVNFTPASIFQVQLPLLLPCRLMQMQPQ